MTGPGVPRALPLSETPGVSRLAALHAAGAPEARAFLPDPFDLGTIRARAGELLAPGARAGSAVPPGLDAGLVPFAARERAAVTAGQQVGLFTGPLLTTVKAVAALSLARDLEAAGVAAGALFWCAAEDHDLVEVTRVPLPGPDGPRDFGPEAAPLEANRSPVGRLAVPEGLEALLEGALAPGPSAAPLPFADDAREFARLATGKSYLEAFVASMRWLLEGEPLAFADAAREEDKPLLVPLARRIVREREEVRRLLAARAAEIEAAGHPLQVRSDPASLPLFVLVDGRRLLVREEEGRFTLKGDKGEGAPARSCSEAELLARLEDGSWLPSFSALSRPLATSLLYPVAATILGPAEVAYWAQMLPLFGWAGLVRPVVVPRPMAVPVDASSRRLLQRTGLGLRDLLGGREALVAARGAGAAPELLAKLASSRDASLAGLDSLRPELLALDPALGKALDATRQNVGFAWGKLSEKAAASAGRADEEWSRSLDRVLAALLPGGKLAERIYSPAPWLARHGRDALRAAILRDVRWDAAGLVEVEL